MQEDASGASEAMLEMESKLRTTESELEEEREEFEQETEETEAAMLAMADRLREMEQVLVCRALLLLCELSLRCTAGSGGRAQ